MNDGDDGNVAAVVEESKWTQITLFWQLWHVSNIPHEICECDHVSAVKIKQIFIYKKNFGSLFFCTFYWFRMELKI